MSEHSWRKSSHCGEGEACVYIAQDPTRTHIAERGEGLGTVMAVGAGAWSAFMVAVKAGGAWRPASGDRAN